MAENMRYIEELSLETLKGLNKSDNWISYLKTASYHYKYSFRDSFLIHAQRPDATAVASYNLWNNVMHRYVNRGAKGIALIDVTADKPQLHYVFDISDTNGGRTPFIWQYKNEYEEQIVNDLSDSFSIEVWSQDFESTLSKIVDSLLDDSMSDLLDELKYSMNGSFHEEVDELNLKLWYEETIRESIIATVLFRCGFELDKSEFDFSQLYNFNTPDTIVQLGKATSNISETILREIEISVKTIEREKRIERSQEHGDQLQIPRRSYDTRSGTERADNRVARQVRIDEEGLSTEKSGWKVRFDGTDGNAISPLQAGGEGSERTTTLKDITNEEEHTAISVEYNVSGDREPSDSGDDTHEINEQDDIDLVLLNGSSYEGGKQRIIDFYYEEHTNKERADFLKNEYGIGGGTITFRGNRSGYHGHNAKGIEIHNYGFSNPSISLTWVEVAKRIGELIDNGRYFSSRYPNEKLLIKPNIAPKEQQKIIDISGAENAPFSLSKKANHKRRTQPEMNYARLVELVPHIMDKRYRYAKLKAGGFMDLSIEWIAEDRIAIAHYGIQNGDCMADPDMTMYVDDETKTVMPATYQNDYVGVYQEVYTDDGRWRHKLSRELTSFLSTWLRNIEFQGHVLKEAQYYSEEMQETPLILDKNGKEYGFDVPHNIVSMAELESQKDTQSVVNEDVETHETESGDIGAENAPFLIDNGEYQSLFVEILKQGNVSKTGKQRIFEMVNESATMELLINDMQILYGDFWSEVDYNNKTIKWHVDDMGLNIFVNGLDKSKLHYTWNEIAEKIIELVNTNEYLTPNEISASQLYEGMTVSLNERKYIIEKLDVINDKIELSDVTFEQGTGFPIMRQDYLSRFEDELKQTGFFESLEQEQEIIHSSKEEKINFHITDDNLGVGGAKDKFRRNINAINQLKNIEAESRLATAEEQEILSQYVGWGGLASAFDSENSSWSSEYAELKLYWIKMNISRQELLHLMRTIPLQ